MSKQFIVDRHTTPGTPALAPVAIPKVPVYDTLADVTADLANLSVGQIGTTKDTGTELSQPVDVVEVGNLHAVTSNAVAGAIGEWENVFGNGNIKGLETKNGKYLAFHFQGYPTTHGTSIGSVPNKWKPQIALYIQFINGAFLTITTNGVIIPYSAQGGNIDLYGDCMILIA